MQFIQCNNRLDVVSVFVFFWGSSMRTMAQHFYVRQRKVQHYKNIVIEYGHFRLKLTGVSRPSTNRNASQVPALSYIVVNCRCSVSPNSMIICLVTKCDSILLCFDLRVQPADADGRWQGEIDDSRPYPAKQTTPSAPCRLRTVIKVDWSGRQEARMYLCDYLMDKWWLWRTSGFDVTLVRRTSDIISSFWSLMIEWKNNECTKKSRFVVFREAR